MATCAQCAVSFTPKPTGPAPTYCSTRCRRRAAYERERTDGRYDRALAARRARPHARYELDCHGCGARMMRGRRDARFCSERCRERARPARCERHPDRPVRARGLCSTCYSDASYTPERRREQRTQTKTCEHCGESYLAQRGDQRFCSLLCRSGGQFRRAYTDAERRAYREASRRRRAALRGVEVEDFDEREIYERDGWCCQICRGPVPQNKIWPHPMSPTLDHIIPLTEDGTSHTRRNVRLAHLVCNTARSNRGGNEQLALIG